MWESVLAGTPGDDNDSDSEIPDEIQDLVHRHENKPEPVEEDFEQINLNSEGQPQIVKIGTSLSLTERRALIELLTEYKDIFAWSYEDMSGLDTDMLVHHIPTYPHTKEVKQKLRRLRPEW